MLFNELGLSAKVLSAVEATGYTTPTPIQAEAIPHALQRRDVLGIAQTGTGKTASFVLPMLTLLEQGRARARMPRSLILEPTRELAAQVAESFTKYGLDQKLNVALLIGGMSFGDQDRKIDRGADVLIATPGRLLDHFERGKLLMTGTEILVIDEADRMLDMGFIPDIERICKMLPFTRQTLFFSATMPPEITRLTEQFLQNPVRVEVAKASSAALTVEQKLVATHRQDWEKRETLRRLIRAEDDIVNAIIFCNRKIDVASLFRSLARHGFSVGALHGDMEQPARTAMLKAFREDKIQLLVASDVAARGLDIPAVSHVFNFDVPIHAEDYVHRIGRTGRAGRSGKAFTLVSRTDSKYLDAIEKLLGTKPDWLDGQTVEQLPPPTEGGENDRSERHDRRSGSPSRRGGGRGRSSESRTTEPGVERSSGRTAQVHAGEGNVAAAAEQPAAVTRSAVNAGASGSARRPTGSRNHEPNARNSGRPGRGGDDQSSPVGFGSDVPAFMLIAPSV